MVLVYLLNRPQNRYDIKTHLCHVPLKASGSLRSVPVLVLLLVLYLLLVLLLLMSLDLNL